MALTFTLTCSWVLDSAGFAADGCVDVFVSHILDETWRLAVYFNFCFRIMHNGWVNKKIKNKIKRRGETHILTLHFKSFSWQYLCLNVLLSIVDILLLLLFIVLNSTIRSSQRACNVACNSVSRHNGST